MITAASVALLVLLGCIVPCLYRLTVGPHTLDRLIAFDLTGILIAASLAVYATIQGSAAYLEISMGLAILSFVGTVAVAYYLERERDI
jgi:multicomponent Na+:H+ antiporter subunit F